MVEKKDGNLQTDIPPPHLSPKKVF